MSLKEVPRAFNALWIKTLNVFKKYNPILFSVFFGLLLYIAFLMALGIRVFHNETRILGWFFVILLSVWTLARFLFPSAVISLVTKKSIEEIEVLWDGFKLHYKNISFPFQARLFFLRRGEHQIYVKYRVSTKWKTTSKKIDLYENTEIEINLDKDEKD